MDQLAGSMEALSALQITSEMEGLDAECKTVLYAKEVLAVILQEVVEEYQGYSRRKIMEFIEDDSISKQKKYPMEEPIPRYAEKMQNLYN